MIYWEALRMLFGEMKEPTRAELERSMAMAGHAKKLSRSHRQIDKELKKMEKGLKKKTLSEEVINELPESVSGSQVRAVLVGKGWIPTPGVRQGKVIKTFWHPKRPGDKIEVKPGGTLIHTTSAKHAWNHPKSDRYVIQVHDVPDYLSKFVDM